jgi:hypothetical protein
MALATWVMCKSLLLVFLEYDMSADNGIIFAQLKAIRSVALIFICVISVGALCTAQFDVDAIFFLGHNSFSSEFLNLSNDYSYVFYNYLTDLTS